MKKTAMLLCAILAMGVVFAGMDKEHKAMGKSHKETVELVSVDLDAKTITIKDDKGETHTAPLLGKASEEAKAYKAGDRLVVTCMDNEKGEHTGISHIEMVKSSPGN
jgi:hypothetical protein